MTKLTTERLERKIKNCIEIEDCQVMLPLAAAQELLAFRRAAKNPVAIIENSEYMTAEQLAGEEPHKKAVKELYEGALVVGSKLYVAPAIPEQPELVENLKKVMNNWLAMEPKLAFQPEFTDVMMLLDAEPHELKIPPAIEPDYEVIKGILPTANPDEYACCVAADMWNACRAEMLKTQQNEPRNIPENIPAQPVSEHKPSYRDGLISAAQWVEKQREAYDNEHGQHDSDTGFFEFGNDAQRDYSETLAEIAEGIRSLHPASAQPVSEPYKLPSGWKLVPEEATIAMLTLLGLTGSFDFMQQKYKNMLAAAPAQESE